jgi:hypothetical protein
MSEYHSSMTGRVGHKIERARYIYVVQYLDKNTWKDANREFHTDDRLAYLQLEAIRRDSPKDFRFRLRRFVEAD